MKRYFYQADVMLPDFKTVSGAKWASVACDQYTSQKEYWEEAYRFASGSYTTLDLMLPEAYLDRESELIPEINQHMQIYAKSVLLEHKDTMIYLERTQADGRVRRGLIGCVDLEEYDYRKGAETLIRATEGTVLERIPPRVAIRRNAEIEMPHIMILIDDPNRTVIDPIANEASKLEVAYDFDLMMNSGHVKGYFVNGNVYDGINSALSHLASKEAMTEKYGIDASPLLFAVGDGNHSLATAKSLYEEIKASVGIDAAKKHPARYALCEIVNLHDTALDFEPIYRAVFGVDPKEFATEFKAYCASLCGNAAEQSVNVLFGEKSETVIIPRPESQLAVGTVQNFLDIYTSAHPEVTVDYIHGEDTVISLAKESNTVGLVFDGMSKDMLFKTVICDGALPRKTFSMGHAADKRFYLECRKIR